MRVVGIIAEYDPFHTGHAWHIAATREALGGDVGVIAVMSGNWTQRADCAVADKWTRAALAVQGGADLVLELPTPWSAASAEHFAEGAAALLHGCGIVEYLSFGSECGELSALRAAADCLDCAQWREGLRPLLAQGLSFAAARQAAVGHLIGAEAASVLAQPNNNLGVEYLRALKRLAPEITAITLPRRGAAHGALSPQGARAKDFASGAQLRRDLREGHIDLALPYLLPGAREALPGPYPALSRAERAILLRLREMDAARWALLPDSGASEGLPNRLARAGRQSRDLDEFYALSKTKRYPLSRLRRLLLWAYLGLDAHSAAAPAYLRVLAFQERGRKLLGEMRRRARLPLVTTPAQVRGLPEQAQRLYALEAHCTDLYELCLPVVPAPGREWREHALALTKGGGMA